MVEEWNVKSNKTMTIFLENETHSKWRLLEKLRLCPCSRFHFHQFFVHKIIFWKFKQKLNLSRFDQLETHLSNQKFPFMAGTLGFSWDRLLKIPNKIIFNETKKHYLFVCTMSEIHCVFDKVLKTQTYHHQPRNEKIEHHTLRIFQILFPFLPDGT